MSGVRVPFRLSCARCGSALMHHGAEYMHAELCLTLAILTHKGHSYILLTKETAHHHLIDVVCLLAMESYSPG